MFKFNTKTPNHHRFMRSFVSASALLLAASVLPLMGPFPVVVGALVAVGLIFIAIIPWASVGLVHSRSVAPWVTMSVLIALQLVLVLIMPLAAIILMQLVALLFAAGINRWASRHVKSFSILNPNFTAVCFVSYFE